MAGATKNPNSDRSGEKKTKDNYVLPARGRKILLKETSRVNMDGISKKTEKKTNRMALIATQLEVQWGSEPEFKAVWETWVVSCVFGGVVGMVL